MLPLATNQTARQVVDGTSELSAGFLVTKSVVEWVQDRYSPALFSRLASSKYLKILPMLAEAAPWLTFSSTVFDIYQVLDRYIEGKSEDQDFSLFLSGFLFLGEGLFFASSPIIAMGLGLSGMGVNWIASKNSDESNANSSSFKTQLGMMIAFTAAQLLSRRGRNQSKEVFKYVHEEYTNHDPKNGLKDLGEFAWSMTLGRFSNPVAKGIAWGVPLAIGGLGLHDTLAKESDNFTEYLWNQAVNKWLQADEQIFIEMLSSKEPVLRDRGINALGDLLAGNRLTQDERLKVIKDLKDLPLGEDATLPPLVAAALEQASKKQQAFLLRADSEKDAEKISQTFFEMKAIGGANNVQFFTENTILSNDIRQLGINFIQKNSWPIYLRTMMEEGTLQEAIEKQNGEIERISINGSTGLADAYTKLGHLELMANHLDEAKEAYTKAINIDSNQGEAYLGLAELALKKEEASEALKYLDHAQPLMPEEEWKLNYNRAMALMMNGEVDESVKYLGMSIRKMEEDPVQAEEWANFYTSYGKLDKALAYIQEAEKLHPDDIEIKNNLAVILGKLGNEKEAIKVYEQGLKIYEGESDNEKSESKKTENVIYLANFLYRLGKAKQYDRAYDITEKLLADPHAELLQDYLRQSLFQLKNQEFSETGEGVSLHMGGTFANLSVTIKPTPQQIKDEIEYWKKVITNPNISDQDKQKALVVLTKLGSLLEDDERVDLSLWTVEAVQTQQGVVQEFGMIATGRMVEGVADTKKLYELNVWLIDKFKNKSDYFGSTLAAKVLEKTSAHLDEGSLLVLAEESAKKLTSRFSTDASDAFSLLAIFVPHIPLKKRSEFADLIVPFLDDRNAFNISSLKTLSHIIPSLAEDKRLDYTELIFESLKHSIMGAYPGPGRSLLEQAPTMFPEFLTSLKLDDRKKLAQDILDWINELSSSKSSLNFNDPSRGIYLFMQLLAEIIPLLNTDDKITFSDKVSHFLESDATDLRSSTVTTLVAIIPSLPSEKRSAYMDMLVDKLKDKNSSVRSESIKGLVEIIPSLNENEKPVYMSVVMDQLEKDPNFSVALYSINLNFFIASMSPSIEARYKKFLLHCFDEDVNPGIAQAAFPLTSRLIPFLDLEDQTVYADKLVEELNDQNERVNSSDVLMFLHVISSLDKTIQSKYMTSFLLRLQSSPNARLISDSRQNYVLEDFMSSLAPSTRSDLAVQITPWLQNNNENVRLRALELFQFVIPYLDKTDQEKYVLLMLGTLKSNQVNNSLKQAFSYLAPLIDKEVCAHVASQIVIDLKVGAMDRSFLLMTLCTFIPFLEDQGDQDTNLVLTYLDNPDAKIRLSVLSSLQPVVLKMDVQSRRACSEKVARGLQDNDAQIRQATISILRSLISNLKPEEQVTYIDQVMPFLKDPDKKTRQKVCDFLSFIPSSSLSPKVQMGYLKQVMLAAQTETDEQTYSNEMIFFERVIPHLPESDREFFIPQIIGRLKNKNSRQSSDMAGVISILFLYIDDPVKHKIMSQIDECLIDSDAIIRRNALVVLQKVIPILDEASQLDYTERVVKYLVDRDQSVQQSAANTLNSLFYLWDDTKKQQMALLVETQLTTGKASTGERLFLTLASSFSDAEKKACISRWIDHLANGNSSTRASAIVIISKLISSLREKDRLVFVQQIETQLDNPDSNVFNGAVSALGPIIRFLPNEERVEQVKKMLPVLKRPGFLVETNMQGPFTLAVQALNNDDERKEVIQLIAANLNDADAQVRANTLLVLSPIIFSFRGSKKHNYMNQAVVSLSDPDKKVREAAIIFFIALLSSLKQQSRLEVIAQALDSLKDATEKKQFSNNLLTQLNKRVGFSPEEKQQIEDVLNAHLQPKP